MQMRWGVLLGVLCLCAEGRTQEPSLILVNGKIWTENPAQPVVQAVALDGDRIAAVGSNAEIRRLAGPSTKVIELRGRLLLPGFNDAHVHLFMGGEALIVAQTRDANSPSEFREKLAAFAKSLPPGAWIRDSLWDHQRWSPPALPNHELIDAACGDHPGIMWRTDGHMILANALALKLAGIDRTTKDPQGGEIERDKDGNPTGILKDAATALVLRVMPPWSEEEKDRAMDAAMREAAAHGVTSVQNMAATPDDEDQPTQFHELEKLEHENKLSFRVYQSMNIRDWKTLADLGVTAPFGSAKLRIGDLKSFADGALGSETAWMDEPFANHPGYTGISSSDLLNLEHFYEELRQADKAGLQITIHAIGDRANRTILDLYARLEKDNGPVDRRLRIEHAQHLHPADYPRFANLHVIASMQPYHAIDDGRWAQTELGPDRINSSYAWKSLLDAHATVAFGSDWPVAPLDPLMGIYAAVSRRTLDGRNPGGWVPNQRITVAQAVHAYTMGSAFAEHQEKVKGSIEPGKLADLVVLSDDIFTIAPEAVEETRVDITIFDGRLVYERK